MRRRRALLFSGLAWTTQEVPGPIAATQGCPKMPQARDLNASIAPSAERRGPLTKRGKSYAKRSRSQAGRLQVFQQLQ